MAKRPTILDTMREICLALPDTRETLTWGKPHFRVGDKIFAGCGDEDGKPTIGFKLEMEHAAEIVGGDPRFQRAPYVGHKGWVSMDVTGLRDWEEVRPLVLESYRLIAPKRSLAKLGEVRPLTAPAAKPRAAQRRPTSAKRVSTAVAATPRSTGRAKAKRRTRAAHAVVIRPIAKRDVPRVWELLRGLAEYEKLTDILTGNATLLQQALFGSGDRIRGLVAERSGQLIGYALFYPVFGSFRARWRLWLEDLYVEPEARGSGAGIALMAELARLALEGDYVGIDWEVIDWNRPALDFYEHLGARPIASEWLRYRLDAGALKKMAKRRVGST